MDVLQGSLEVTDTMQRYIDRIKELEGIISDLKEELQEAKDEVENLYEQMAGEDI